MKGGVARRQAQPVEHRRRRRLGARQPDPGHIAQQFPAQRPDQFPVGAAVAALAVQHVEWRVLDGAGRRGGHWFALPNRVPPATEQCAAVLGRRNKPGVGQDGVMRQPRIVEIARQVEQRTDDPGDMAGIHLPSTVVEHIAQ